MSSITQLPTSTTNTPPTTTAQTPASRFPDAITFQNAAKIAISEDKPIMMDYWTSSIDKTAIIGVRENKEKLLVKIKNKCHIYFIMFKYIKYNIYL